MIRSIFKWFFRWITYACIFVFWLIYLIIHLNIRTVLVPPTHIISFQKIIVVGLYFEHKLHFEIASGNLHGTRHSPINLPSVSDETTTPDTPEKPRINGHILIYYCSSPENRPFHHPTSDRLVYGTSKLNYLLCTKNVMQAFPVL